MRFGECRPGTGNLDYRTYLERMTTLPDNTCLMLEHMSREEDCILAAKYFKGLAAEMNIQL